MEYKYEVKVNSTEVKQKLPDSVRAELKASGMMTGKEIKLSGVSPKMLKRMKQEYVDCPVLEAETHFIQCFICPNFQSRVNGRVLCKGGELYHKTL